MTDNVAGPDGSELSDGLGLAPERAFEAWAFDQPDFTTTHPWDVARSAYLAAVAAERERWKRERKDYRSLLMQARLVLRGPQVEQNIVVRELVARIEARGVQFGT